MGRIGSWLVPFIVLGLIGCGGKSPERAVKIGFMPKLVGIPYFVACKRGAEEAAKELGIELVFNGPTAADANQQINMLNQWVASGQFACIVVACNDPDLVAPALAQAKKKNIHVVTYDADSKPEARDYFVNQATYVSVAHAMVDEMASELEPRGTGKVGILTSFIQAPNQRQWADRMKSYAKQQYPNMQLLDEAQHGEDRNLGIQKAKAMIQAHEDIKGIIGLTSVAVPAAAEAVRQEKKAGKIKVSGVSTPQDMRDYVMDGTVHAFILWNPVDLGYLAVHVAELLRKQQMHNDGTIEAGRLGSILVKNREVLLGKPLRFTKDNIDKFDF